MASKGSNYWNRVDELCLLQKIRLISTLNDVSTTNIFNDSGILLMIAALIGCRRSFQVVRIRLAIIRCNNYVKVLNKNADSFHKYFCIIL